MPVRQPIRATGYDAAKELCYFSFSDKNTPVVKPLINVGVLGTHHPIHIIILCRCGMLGDQCLDRLLVSGCPDNRLRMRGDGEGE